MPTTLPPPSPPSCGSDQAHLCQQCAGDHGGGAHGAHAVTADQAEQWIEEGIITGGMIPKVRSATNAVANGITRAVITNIAGVQEGGGTGVIGSRTAK